MLRKPTNVLSQEESHLDSFWDTLANLGWFSKSAKQQFYQFKTTPHPEHACMVSSLLK